MADSPPQVLEGSAAFAEAAIGLAEAAVRELCLLSYALDSRCYGGAGFAEAVKRLLLSSERSRLRILVNQPRDALQGGCAHLLQLAHRVPSRAEIRELTEETQQEWRCERLLADARGLLERRAPESLAAQLWSEAPLEGRRMQKEFDKLWEQSTPASELRRLGV